MNDPIDKDILISRVIDGEASAEDWSALRALAARDEGVWADLSSMQQDCAELGGAFGGAMDAAAGVEAPILEHARQRFTQRLRLAGTWGGWAAAAALVLAWAVDLPGAEPEAGMQRGSLVPDVSRQRVIEDLSAEEALEAYLRSGSESGRVLAQDPELTVVRTQPLEGGEGFEVVYIRQILERAEVDLYRMARDEAGAPVAVPLDRLPRATTEF